MKEIIGKKKIGNCNAFPSKVTVNDQSISDENEIAQQFNKFFVDVEKNLASTIAKSKHHYSSYKNRHDTSLSYTDLTIGELTNAFKSLKKDKAEGYDDINSNVGIKIFEEIQDPLYHKLRNFLKFDVFPNIKH